jgi:hypothetical protein
MQAWIENLLKINSKRYLLFIGGIRVLTAFDKMNKTP